MTNEEAAAAIAAAFEDLEEAANTAVDTARGLDDAWAQLATIANVSRLETLRFASEMKAITERFRADLYTLHSKGFQRTTAVGIDNLFPEPRGGTR